MGQVSLVTPKHLFKCSRMRLAPGAAQHSTSPQDSGNGHNLEGGEYCHKGNDTSGSKHSTMGLDLGGVHGMLQSGQSSSSGSSEP